MQITFDDEMLQEINASVDLLDYVSQTIDIERRGNDYFGRCPLHIDNTPSFSITPAKNSYYCFSCGKSGGIIGYLMDYEGLGFEDAVKKAAELANMDMSKMCKSQTVSFLKRIKTILSGSNKVEYEHKILDKSEIEKYSKEKVTEWLDEGIEQEVLDLFGVRVDNWTNRIVYPVYDMRGNLINIKARTRYPNYKQMKIPKYINYFQIGVMDYFQGLNVTLPYIQEKNEIIIFESIKSVMKAYGWGYKNCVSAEKHTLTDEQIRLLVKMHVNIVFAYDADINYWQHDVKKDIDKLKRVTNVYVIEDRDLLLGGAESKNAPVDKGKEIWDELYSSKRKVV